MWLEEKDTFAYLDVSSLGIRTWVVSLSALLMTKVTRRLMTSSVYWGPPSPSTNFAPISILIMALSLFVYLSKLWCWGDWFYFKNEHGATGAVGSSCKLACPLT